VRIALAFAIAIGAAFAAGNAGASMTWRWVCSGEGLEARGRLTTADAPDANGFYAITGIEGEANGVAITGLQPAGSAIPGNKGWPVDGLVREAEPQLSEGGFGFGLADGGHVNPFFGARFDPPGVLAVITNPAKGEWREPRVQFRATRER
jgi:hypothetical protein